MNDTTRRFLTAVVERIPTDGRIVELRLFPAIRQGGVESAVAVVAVQMADPIFGAASPDAETTMAGAPDEGDVAAVAPEVEGPAGVPANGDADVTGAAMAQGHDLAVTADYALAAHELVDTDVSAEDEDERSAVDVETTPSFVPHADTADDDAVGDALDEELHTIVVDVARDVVAAEAPAFAAASGTHPQVNIDEGPAHARHDPQRPLSAEAGEDTAAAVDATDSGGAVDSAYREEPNDEVEASRDRSLDDSPYADAPLPVASSWQNTRADVAVESPDVDPDIMRLDDILALSSSDEVTDDNREAPGEDPSSVARAAIRRYAILTASYRLTLKGPDRGKWEVEITHEADAPLATVERVARGVAKRAGEDSQPEHFSGESLQQALDAPAWVTTA